VITALGGLIRAAPAATFIVGLALSPILVLSLHRPLRNGVAGIAILFRRTVVEGDQVTLEGGQKGIVRQIRLTTTLARTDGGAKLTVPNSRLLELVLEVDRRQSGVPIEVRLPLLSRPSEKVMRLLRRVALLSTYRSPDSVVNTTYSAGQVIVEMRIPRSSAADSARREILGKLTAGLRRLEEDQAKRSPSGHAR
jgi:small-conductance mechanosensitive channel